MPYYNGNEYIIVLSDYFSNWVEAYAVPNHTTLTVADKIVTVFFCRQTDQGREFESEIFKCICERLEIKKTRSCSYRPQSSGLAERFNATLQKMLSLLVNESRND